MAAGGDTEYLQAAAVYLGAAVVAAPVFKRLKLGSVLGYLFAGALIGPHALGALLLGADADIEGAMALAEFGVVLLLFVIGLELKPSRLWRLRTEIFGLGLAQVLLTGLVVGLAMWALSAAVESLDWRGAIAAGAGLALSSTAFAIQILRERGELSTPYGDRAFAILLFQDIAIVPLLALVSLIAPSGPTGDAPVWLIAAKAIGAVAFVFVAGRYGLGPLFRFIALSKAEEAFTAAALLVVIASALVMQLGGLSMALGAFMAGVLLADSEFRHQLETDIAPFRGLLMGLFFMAVGMSIDLGAVADNLAIVIASVLLLVTAKAAILFALASAAGSPPRDAVRIAAVLCQGGEFGFVLFALAASGRALDPEITSMLTAVVAISMAVTPLAVLLAERAAERMGPSDSADAMDGLETVDDAPDAPIIIAGFGRFGQVVARILRMRGYEVVLIDNSPRRIRMAESFGNKVYFGDARRIDTLQTAGAETARAIFLCIDDRDGMRVAVERIRQRFPHVTIFGDTYDRFSMLELQKAGAHHIERETFESAISLATKALIEFGDGDAVDEVVSEFRRADEKLLRLQSEYGAQEGLRKLREEFTLEKEN